MAKRTLLTDALAKAAQTKSAPEPPPRTGKVSKKSTASKPPKKAEPTAGAGARAPGTKPYRMGRVNITGYFMPEVKASLRMIQVREPDRTVQDLLAEALNDLFAKYNVPQTAKLAD
jgi:hypothetical protein